MAIEFTCKAGHKIRVPDELAGKSVRCPKCSERIVVPPAARKPVEASTSDVRLIESSKQRPAKSARKASPPPPFPGKGSPSKRIWFLAGGIGAAALVLLAGG